MNIVSQMNILFSPNFVGIINPFLSYVKISGKKKKRKEKEQNYCLLWGLLLCALLSWINPDKPTVCCFFLLKQEENRTETTHLRVGETIAEGRGKGECLYSVFLRIFFVVRCPLWDQRLAACLLSLYVRIKGNIVSREPPAGRMHVTSD